MALTQEKKLLKNLPKIYYFTYNKLRKLKGGFILNKICGYGCLECGMPIYNYEVDLLDGLCPKCYDVYYKELIKEGKKPTVILGFNTKDEIFYENEFKTLGVETIITTVDGSYGLKGFVTDAMASLDYSYIFTCGPLPMLKAVYNASKTSGQFSFEERMGCGFGACMGCSCKTKYGNKRICKDGPVLIKEEIIW